MNSIKKYLLSNADQKYRDFTLPLVPNIDPKTVIGVRLPVIKKYAKSLKKEEIEEFLVNLPHEYHEENILHAYILSNIKNYDEFINYIDIFLSFVTNWSVCDTISNKYLNKYKD